MKQVKDVHIPMPVTILGAFVDNRPNYQAQAWITRCNPQPVCFAAAVNHRHKTYGGIIASGYFSVSLVNRLLLQRADYCGMVSGHKESKETVFEYFAGDCGQAPMISEAPLTFTCKVRQTVPVDVDNLIIGEVVEAWCQEEYMGKKCGDLRRMEPVLLTMPDNKYYFYGDQAGLAWHDGKALRRQTEGDKDE